MPFIETEYPVENRTAKLSVKQREWEASWMGRPVFSIESIDFPGEDPYQERYRYAADLIAAFLRNLKAGSFVSCRTQKRNYRLIHVLEKNGFKFIETYLYMECQNISTDTVAEQDTDNLQIRSCTPHDIDRVMEIARKSFVHDRFHSDPRIPDKLAGYSRTLWVQNALSDPKKQLYVALANGRLGGFNCVKIQDNRTIIDLIAVDSSMQSRGIGSGLVRHMFQNYGVGKSTVGGVGTQAHNISSVHFYLKHGFRISDVFYTFHLHL